MIGKIQTAMSGH